MHLIQSSKQQKPAPLVPIISTWKVPGIRKMRGKRFDAHGKYVGPCGPRKPIPDPSVIREVKAAYAAAAKMPMPTEDGGGFDLNRYRPLPHRILVIRGPQIKQEKGIELPENKWRHEPYYIVIRIGDGVTDCGVGDRVIFHKKHKPKSVRLGSAIFYLARETALVAIWEAVDPI